MTRKKVHNHSNHRPNYIVQVSNNVTLFFSPNIFHPGLVKSRDMEPVDMEG